MTLILAAGAMLLWSDRHSRHRKMTPPPNASVRIPVALLHSSNPQLDETRQGILDGLAAHGFRDGEQSRRAQ